MEFREKEGYRPEVKLEYVDEAGRTMTPKEAFRYLSHRFHGKGSGKKKLEKRIKKSEEDQVINSTLFVSVTLYCFQINFFNFFVCLYKYTVFHKKLYPLLFCYIFTIT